MLNEYRTFNVVSFCNILVPVAVDWDTGSGVGYSTLYIFGIRVARWRARCPELGGGS